MFGKQASLSEEMFKLADPFQHEIGRYMKLLSRPFFFVVRASENFEGPPVLRFGARKGIDNSSKCAVMFGANMWKFSRLRIH